MRDLYYDENKNAFYKKNKNKSNLIFEKNLTLNEINSFYKKLNKSTLTDADILLLHNLSSNGFKTNHDLISFREIPLKKLFPNKKNCNISSLMVMAYKYNNNVKREKFTENSKLLSENYATGINPLVIQGCIFCSGMAIFFVFICFVLLIVKYQKLFKTKLFKNK